MAFPGRPVTDEAFRALPPGTLPSDFNTEEYGVIDEPGFVGVTSAPLSIFSIDVDTAAYANVRRFLREGRWRPPPAPTKATILDTLSRLGLSGGVVAPVEVTMTAAKAVPRRSAWDGGELAYVEVSLIGPLFERGTAEALTVRLVPEDSRRQTAAGGDEHADAGDPGRLRWCRRFSLEEG